MPPSRPAMMTPSARTSMRDSATSDYLSRILDLEQELEEVQDELDAERPARRESKPHYMADCEVMQTEINCMQQVCESGSNMPNAERLQLHRSLHRATRAQLVEVEATTMFEGYD
ncbi:hypothetical protein FCV25MIE_01090 [Fagus crenata]